MIPQIKTLPETKLIGLTLNMSIAANKTGLLWSTFMPRRKEISNPVSSDFYSVQVYPEGFSFSNFDMHATFDKWATLPVTHFEYIPEGMQTLTVPEGLYAVFYFKGSLAEAPRVFQYIFGEWLPGSDYLLDNRPHFEVLGDKYKNNDPDSEEEIWIPVKLKK